MLEFKKYSYEELKKVSRLVKESPYLCSDISLGTLLMWNKGLNVEFCVFNGTFIVKESFGDDTLFSYPYGDDIDGALKALTEYVTKNNLPLKFFGVDEALLEQINSDARFRFVNAVYDRKWSDYIYDFNDILTFKGNKYKGQRNHINNFKKLYGEPVFKAITKDDIPKIKNMLNEYSQNNAKTDYFAKAELKHNYALLDTFLDLGLLGIYLTVNGKIVSFTIGEIIGDMLIVHIEKALTEYKGVYPTTFNCFARYIKEQNIPCSIINREDDSGDLGLRTSKLQYKPIKLLNKYYVKINSPVNLIDSIPNICKDDFCLTAFKETDKQNYFNLCTDIDNNKYWGYDYRQDHSVGDDIDQNTFYDVLWADYSSGDSVNFAIRHNLNSQLLGEVIIYRFTFGGTAEIGCRVLKEHQGKGLGKKAFKAGADFAEDVLNVKPTARCFKENTASFCMITAAGFKKVNEDEKFYYFERQ